ncbi:MAG: MFS transporter [Arachnia sp.]
MALQTDGSVRRLVAASVWEALGDATARTVIPLVAVGVLGAGTGLVGFLNAVGLLAFLVLGAPLGAVADRASPTRLMMASTVTRAAVAAVGLSAWWSGLLTGVSGVVLLVVMALVVGAADVVYGTARGALIPRLVDVERVRPVFGRVQTASQSGGLLAPIVLVAVLALVPVPLAWAVVLLAYAASALTQRGITAVQAVVAVRTPFRRAVRAGFGHLLGQRTLRSVTAANALANASAAAANTLLPVIALSALGLSPAVYALLGVLGAAAGLAGAATASWLTRVIGLRAARTLGAACLALGASTVGILVVAPSLLPGPTSVWLGVESALAGLGISVMVVAGADLPARLIPADKLGVVTGAQQAIVVGIMPLSAVAFGVVGAASLTSAVVAWAVCSAIAVVLAVTMPRPAATGCADR